MSTNATTQVQERTFQILYSSLIRASSSGAPVSAALSPCAAAVVVDALIVVDDAIGEQLQLFKQ
jgi:hypothetical protein